MKISIGNWLAISCGAVCFWIYSAWSNFSENFYRQQIPVEVQVDKLIHVDSGFRSCGGAIFEVTPQSKARLVMSGVHGLSGIAPEYEIDTSPGISTEWKETPYVPPDNEVFGESIWSHISCMWVGKQTTDMITNALMKPGSFFRYYKEGATLVIPAAGIVVYLF